MGKESTRPVWRTGLLAGAGVAAANTGIFVAAQALDVPFVVDSGDDRTTVTAWHVVTMSFLAVTIGTALAVVGGRRAGARGVRFVQVAALVVAVASIGGPLSAADRTATAVVLVSMHLVAGANFVVALRRAATA